MLDLINLFGLAVTMATDIHMIYNHDIPPAPLHAVVRVEAKPQVPLWSDERKCLYSGVLVPYDRTWEETTEAPITHAKTVTPADPGNIDGYAVLINMKTCEGKVPEHLFNAATEKGLFVGRTLREGIHFRAATVTPDNQPKWLPQVMDVLNKAANENDAVAKDFLAFSAAGQVQIKSAQSPAPESGAN